MMLALPHRAVLSSAALTLATAASPAFAGTIHVNWSAPPGGDGTSWATAFDDLQTALAAAAPGDEIWVAAGTYTPDGPGGDRAATFQMISGVALYGGFGGTESDASERDHAANPTILSGDLNGNDGPGFAGNDENSWHVVTADGVDETAVLDGLTITGGHANGTDDSTCFGGVNHGFPCNSDLVCGPQGTCVSPDGVGAGITAVAGRPTIVDCTITDNFAEFQAGGIMLKTGSHATILRSTFTGNRAGDNGGAMYLGGSSPLVQDCHFEGNEGGNYAGASCNRDLSDATFLNCSFVDNTASEAFSHTGGGAIVNAASSPLILGCTFTGNRSFVGNGGAIYNKKGFDLGLGPSSPTIQGCVFDDNRAGAFGGAIYNIEQSEPNVTSCSFTQNDAEKGGVMYSDEQSFAVVTGCGMIDNTAEQGGCLYNLMSDARFSDCTLEGSYVVTGGLNDGYGAAVYNNDASPIFTRCVFTGATAERYGGVMYSEGLVSEPAFTDCTMTDNFSHLGGGAIYVANESGLTLTGCRIARNVAAHPTFGGSAIFLVAGRVTLDRCEIVGNSATPTNGAIYLLVDENYVTMTNCKLFDNLGGDVIIFGLENTTNEVTITNCSIGRQATDISIGNGLGTVDVHNTIVWNSHIFDDGATTVTYSNTEFGFPGIGNVSVDPLFMNEAVGDLRLQPGSPCIDAGSNSMVPPGVVMDLDGGSRFLDDGATADTGEGAAPVVDIGAYEYPGSPCPGDVDGSGAVDFDDVLAILSGWGPCVGCPEDTDGDGTVGFFDLLVVLSTWGPCL